MREIFRFITETNMGDVFKSSQVKTLCLSFIHQAFDDFSKAVSKDIIVKGLVWDAFGAMEILVAAKGNPTDLFPEYFSTALKKYRVVFPDHLYKEAQSILQVLEHHEFESRTRMELKLYMREIQTKLT